MSVAPQEPIKVGADIQDGSSSDKEFDRRQWAAMTHQHQQQTILIRAMLKMFAGLNVAVVIMVIVFWCGGIWLGAPHIITEKVVMSLIGATVVQLGVAFALITKHFFPSGK